MYNKKSILDPMPNNLKKICGAYNNSKIYSTKNHIFEVIACHFKRNAFCEKMHHLRNIF